MPWEWSYNESKTKFAVTDTVTKGEVEAKYRILLQENEDKCEFVYDSIHK